jgi:hypothetical protein
MSFSISMAISVLMKGSHCTASRGLISRLLSFLIRKGLGFSNCWCKMTCNMKLKVIQYEYLYVLRQYKTLF